MAGIPQVITEDRASGAQFIDGSLKFDESKGQYLKFTPSASGNRRTQTLSVWIKNTYTGGNNKIILGGGDNPSQARHNIAYNPTKQFGVTQNPTGSTNANTYSVGVFRDYSGWQHLVMSLDCTVGANSGQVRIYVNGKLQDNGGYGGGNAAYISDQDGIFNTINKRMYLGHYAANPSDPAEFDGYMSQFYWIDGLALGPKYFGYTDPLTGTWRPRKFKAEGTTLNDGTNWSGSTTNLTNGDNGFNGNLGNYAEVSSSGAKGTVTFPKSIKVENSVTFWYSSGQPGNLFINDETTAMEVTGGFHQQDIEFTGTLSSVSIQSGSQPAIWGIAVDGTILESTVTQNLDFGTNGAYLPFDGNTPIGQDQSGKGNNWEPVNFGGSVELSKATGAIPILNTNGGGTVAKNDVRTDSKTYTVTASGGKYYLDGVETPTLNFLRGGTYIFDYTGATSHPFKFSTTSDGTHNSGSEYTDGTNTSTTNVMKITVPHNAPDILYYYCSAHSGMGSSINVTTDVLKADPYAWKCVLAMPLVGYNADESKNINCTQSAAKTITSTGNAAASSGASNFYGGSFGFDGNGDYLQCTSSSDYDMNSDFTAEAWVYPTSHANDYAGIFGFSYDSEGVGWNVLIRSSSGRIHINVDMTHTDVTNSLQLNKWTHLALVRSSGTSKIYIDGIADPTTITDADTTGTPSGKQCYIGSYPGYETAREFTGYIQDVRVYKGVAKYTENFVVGSTAPDVLPDTPSGVSGKSNLTKITDGAVYLGGSPDELTLPDSDDFNFGSGEFTVEAFIEGNFGGTRTGSVILNQSVGGASSDSAFYFGCGTDGTSLYLSTSGSSWTNYIECANSKITRSGWHHIVWQRRGDVMEIYVDGIKQTVTSGSNSGNAAITGSIYNSSRAIEIGPQNNSGYYAGHISNLRVIKGTALYTSNFTPPTEPLTTTSQGATASEVKLLCCQSNTEPGGAAVAPSISGPNNGTQWSSKVTSDSLFRSGFPAAYAFNGDTKSNTNQCTATPQTAGQGFTFTFGGGVPFTTLQMQCDPNGSGGARVKANGVDITSQLTNGSLTNTTITGVTSPLTSLSLVSRNGDAGYLGSITIDGVMLRDPLTPNGDAAATNFNPFTDDINTIRGQETGYATFNPLLKGTNTTLSNGNLTVSSSGGTFEGFTTGNILIPKTGKWFVEFTAGSCPSSTYYGMYNTKTFNPYGFGGTGFFGLQADTGNKFKSTGSGSYMSAVSVGDVVGVMYDADNNTIGFIKNGINHGVAFDSSDDIDYTDDHGVWWNTNGATSVAHTINFGQKPFKFPPPDGFQPLNLSSVQPDKVIARPDQYVGVSLWSGNGTSQNVTGLQHKPDFVWIKKRAGGSARSHQLFDSVRGVYKTLHSDGTSIEDTNTNRLTAFNQDGFAVGGDDGANGSSGTFVGWTWKAGGDKNTFNIDDVGYANASDVNMNVGAFNDATYNQDQNWGSLMSVSPGTFDQSPDFAFNGFISGGSNRLRTSDNQATVTMNLSSAPVTVSSQIKVIGEPGYTSSCTVTVGGVTYNSSFVQSTGAHTFNVSGSLTQMVLTGTSSGGRTYMEQMEIDGKILVNSGTTINAPSIAPTGCSVGTKQGFSIIKWQGDGSDANRTVPHGLLEAPSFVIVKPLTESRHWLIWHKGYNDDDAAMLFDTGTPAGARFGPNAPTSNVFGVYGGQGNRGTTDFIGYCWHDVPGLQKFGTYEGIGGTANGSFVELGFRPAIVWVKNIDTASQTNTHWCVFDNARPGYNTSPAQNRLHLDQSAVEDQDRVGSGQGIDILSNGFRLRSDNWYETNLSGATYIYCAWAEAPTVNLYGGHANAR